MKLKFLIFTRTCNRRIFFDECYNSINQLSTHENITVYHFVSYDDRSTLYSYLNDDKYSDVIKVKTNKVKRESFEHFPYNLYFNHLYDHVITNYNHLYNDHTWILYLDDDDLYIDKEILVDLYDIITRANYNENLLLLWKVKFPFRVIPSYSFGIKPEMGEMSTIGICHNIMMYNYPNIRWDNMKQGDYRFVTRLFNLENIKHVWINKIYTAINYSEGVGGLGMAKDKKPIKKITVEKHNESDEIVKCPHCNIMTKRRYLHDHIQRKHEYKRKCDACRMTFKHEKTYRQHLKSKNHLSKVRMRATANQSSIITTPH